MAFVALVVCIIICAIAAICIAAPSWIVKVMLNFSPSMLYYAAGFRIVIGTVLILAAPTSRAPDTIYILGIVIVVAGIVLLFVGQKRFAKMIQWLATRGPTFVRVAGVVGLVLGCALGYGVTP